MSTKTQTAQSHKPSTNLPAVIAPEKGKNDLISSEVEIKPLIAPTAEQRIKNLRNLSLLTERFELLKEKEDELNTFLLSSDGTQDRFKLSNFSGHSFEFTNSQVIEEVSDVVVKHLKSKIEKTEREILEFVV